MIRACFNVTTLDDDILEAEEDFNLNLNSTDENVVLDPEMAVVTISDNDRELY